MAAQIPPPFATHAKVAELTGQTFNPAEQARLTVELAAVSSAIRRECGWHVAPVLTGHSLTVDGSGASVQMLPTLRLLALNAIAQDGVVLDPAAVEWSENGYLRNGGRWTRRARGLVVSIDHGYELDEVPELVKLAMGVALRSLHLAAVPGGGGLRQIGTGPFSATFAPGELDDDELGKLAPFRIGG